MQLLEYVQAQRRSKLKANRNQQKKANFKIL